MKPLQQYAQVVQVILIYMHLEPVYLEVGDPR